VTAAQLLGVLPGRLSSLSPILACGAFLFGVAALGDPPDLGTAQERVQGLTGTTLALSVIALVIVATLLDPLQLRLVRLLEGDWPRWAAPYARRSARWQARRRSRLAASIVLLGPDSTPEQIRASGLRTGELARRFPPTLTRPTALGNALAAMESQAGREFGWDAVVAWPRLYPLLSDGVKLAVDGQRERLDTLARLAVSAAFTAAVTAGLLWSSDWWVLLAGVPVLVSRLAYLGAVHTTFAYAQAVQVAFDLHRFDLLRQLHMRLPTDAGDERELGERISLKWRQGVNLDVPYEH
jgi:hypothetical protein